MSTLLCQLVFLRHVLSCHFLFNLVSDSSKTDTLSNPFCSQKERRGEGEGEREGKRERDGESLEIGTERDKLKFTICIVQQNEMELVDDCPFL